MKEQRKGEAESSHHDEAWHRLATELRGPTRELRREIPDVWRGFGELHDAALSDGALPSKVKELIALAIAVSRGCDGCIGHHAHAAARAGANPHEVAEALAVALLMSGGPASVYGPRAWEAYQEFVGRESRMAPAS